MVMSPVEGRRWAVVGLEQVDPPQRLGDSDRLGGVEVAPQAAPLQQPNLQADAPFGALLAGQWRRILEVQITEDNAGRFEAEDVEHARSYDEAFRSPAGDPVVLVAP